MITLAVYDKHTQELVKVRLNRVDSTLVPLDQRVPISGAQSVGYELISTEPFPGFRPDRVTGAMNWVYDEALRLGEAKYGADLVVFGEFITKEAPKDFFQKRQLYLDVIASMYVLKNGFMV